MQAVTEHRLHRSIARLEGFAIECLGEGRYEQARKFIEKVEIEQRQLRSLHSLGRDFGASDATAEDERRRRGKPVLKRGEVFVARRSKRKGEIQPKVLTEAGNWVGV